MPSNGKKSKIEKKIKEDLVREQTSQPSDCDNSESGFSSTLSSGVMMGGNSASRYSSDLSYGVTTTGDSR